MTKNKVKQKIEMKTKWEKTEPTAGVPYILTSASD